MSREIKFRAWDGLKIIYPDSDGWFNNCKFANETILQTCRLDIALKNLEVMQFTGLLDKNGKEIFEGDILSHRYYSKPVICEFVDGSFIFDDISKYDKSLEVIGNLYENPELLGGKNE